MTNELEKLLGGYATGTLTGDERKALFEAALDDQQLFNALADEEALKVLLDDPESRRRLLHALAESSSRRTGGWFAKVFESFLRPLNLALAGSIAAAAVAVFVFVNLMREAPRQITGPPVSENTSDSLQLPATLVPPDQAAEPLRSRETESLPPPPRLTPTIQAGRTSRPAAAPTEVPQADSQRGAQVDRLFDARRSEQLAYRFSLRQPFVRGPAQQLFYGHIEHQQRPAAGSPAPHNMQDAKRSSQPAAEGRLPTPSGFAQLQSQPGAPPRIGLRIGLEKQGTDGVTSAIKLDSPLDEREQPRLTVEANTTGYLYIAKENAGVWRWLFPPSSGPGGGPADAGIREGQQVIIPLHGSAGLARDPVENRLLIVLSRYEVSEFSTILSQAHGSEIPSSDIQSLLERWRTSNEEPLIGEEGPQKRIYFVSTASAATAPLVIQLDAAPL